MLALIELTFWQVAIKMRNKLYSMLEVLGNRKSIHQCVWGRGCGGGRVAALNKVARRGLVRKAGFERRFRRKDVSQSDICLGNVL